MVVGVITPGSEVTINEISPLIGWKEMQEMGVQSLGGEDPLEKGTATTPVFLPRESHEQRSLADCGP